MCHTEFVCIHARIGGGVFRPKNFFVNGACCAQTFVDHLLCRNGIGAAAQNQVGGRGTVGIQHIEQLVAWHVVEAAIAILDGDIIGTVGLRAIDRHGTAGQLHAFLHISLNIPVGPLFLCYLQARVIFSKGFLLDVKQVSVEVVHFFEIAERGLARNEFFHQWNLVECEQPAINPINVHGAGKGIYGVSMCPGLLQHGAQRIVLFAQ